MDFKPVQTIPLIVHGDIQDAAYVLLNQQADVVVDSTYAQGMYNGMELILSMYEKRQPLFQDKAGNEVTDIKTVSDKRYRRSTLK